MVSCKIDPWSPRHQVNNYLNQPLTFQSVTAMLITLKILEGKVQLGSVEVLLAHDDLLAKVEAINRWEDVSEVSLLHRLELIDEVRHNFQHFLLEGPHVSERTVIHYIDAIVILYQYSVIMMFFDEVHTA